MRILVRYTDNTEEWLEDVMTPTLDFDGFVMVESVGEHLSHLIPRNSIKCMRIVGKARL